jgi:hypothetical protein
MPLTTTWITPADIVLTHPDGTPTTPGDYPPVDVLIERAEFATPAGGGSWTRAG